MKVHNYLGLAILLTLAHSALSYSYSSSYDKHLDNRTKTNPITVASKPTLEFISSDNQIKLASVSFITSARRSISFTCKPGQEWYKGKCVSMCDRTVYPLAPMPETKKGSLDSCTDVKGTYWRFVSCNEGWELNSGDCVIPDGIEEYPLSEISIIVGTGESKKFGDDLRWKYTYCNEGWDGPLNGECSIHDCSSSTYPYTTDPGNDAGTKTTCKTGTAYRYGYSNCNTGWDKSGSYCNVHICTGYPLTSATTTGCASAEACKSGNSSTVYKCVTPADGYGIADGTPYSLCSYPSTTKPTGCSIATDYCVKNNTTYYTNSCSTCYAGYLLSSGTCNKTCN